MLFPLLAGVVGFLSLIFLIICLDIIRHKPARSHTRKSLVSQYLFGLFCRILGPLGMLKFKRQSKSSEALQDKLLLSILSQNRETLYAQHHELSDGNILSKDQYVTNQPLTSYQNFENYVSKIIDGEKNILTKEDPVYLATTSGTTGKAKLYPITPTNKKKIVKAALAMMHRHHKVYSSLKRVWQFRIFSAFRYTDAGLPIGGLALHMAQPYPYNVVPNTITKIHTEFAAFYVQALFVLQEPELAYIDGFSSCLMYSFFKFLEANYLQICDDIATGTLSGKLDIDQDIRNELIANLRPNPSRANFVREQLELGSAGLAKRLWPELEYAHLSTSAGMKLSADFLKKSYLRDVKLFSVGHGASETFVGYQIEEELESEVFTMLPDGTSFLEFIPVEHSYQEQPRTLYMNQVHFRIICWFVTVTYNFKHQRNINFKSYDILPAQNRGANDKIM